MPCVNILPEPHGAARGKQKAVVIQFGYSNLDIGRLLSYIKSTLMQDYNYTSISTRGIPFYFKQASQTRVQNPTHCTEKLTQWSLSIGRKKQPNMQWAVVPYYICSGSVQGHSINYPPTTYSLDKVAIRNLLEGPALPHKFVTNNMVAKIAESHPPFLSSLGAESTLCSHGKVPKHCYTPVNCASISLYALLLEFATLPE
jgi:hypothetical protein